MVLPLAVGGASYVLVGVLAGSVFGISRWYSIALMIVLDAILRLAIIAVALSFTHDVVVLAWCVVIPFPLAIAAAWPFIRRPIVGRTQLDVGPKQLIRNVSHTVVAAASTGVMVSGFPLLLSLTSPAEPKQVVGLYILCITLTRAPLIVILMSLQSYLVVTFRDDIEQFGERFLRVIGLIVGAGFVLALAAWFAGPTVFAWLFPGELVPQDWLLALLVASSAFVGCMSVSGSALLARGGHFAYSLGWVVAALATIAIILFPLGFSTRTVAALIIGPAAGIVVHGISLIRRRRSGMVVKG
jgi:hypothetical protein